MIVNACTATIPTTMMLYFAALSVVFATVSVAVPSMAAELVGLAIARLRSGLHRTDDREDRQSNHSAGICHYPKG
jgi:hypothetical protein